MRYISSLEKAAVTKRGCGRLRKWLLGGIAGLWVGSIASAAGVVSTPDSYFPIGVWSQPLYTFDKWQSRGINTVVNFEPYGGQNTIDQWSDAANAHSLYQGRQPPANPAGDLKETRRLAWRDGDEPHLHKVSPSVPAGPNANSGPVP